MEEFYKELYTEENKKEDINLSKVVKSLNEMKNNKQLEMTILFLK